MILAIISIYIWSLMVSVDSPSQLEVRRLVFGPIAVPLFILAIFAVRFGNFLINEKVQVRG